MSDVTSLSTVLFGKVADRESAIDFAKWAGNGFFMVAAMFCFFSLLIVFHSLSAAGIYLSGAIIYMACGYLTRVKLSRVAAMTGVFFALFCFPFSGLLPGGSGGLVFGLSTWLGIRGIEATFKLRGRFSDDAKE